MSVGLGGRALRRRRSRQPDARSTRSRRRARSASVACLHGRACASRSASTSGRSTCWPPARSARVQRGHIADGPRARLRAPRLAARAPVRAALSLDGAARASACASASRSPACPGWRTWAYTSPAPSQTHGAPFTHSAGEAVWLSPGAALAIAMVIAVLVVLALFVLLRPRTASLRRRLAPYIGAEDPEAGVARRTALLGGRLRKGAERSLEQARWWPGFIENLDDRAHRPSRRSGCSPRWRSPP